VSAPQEPLAAAPLPAGVPAAKKKRRIPGWVELPLTIVLALILALIVKTFLVQVFYIPSGSMEQTLMVNDRVSVNRLAYRLGEPRRGDVVVFDGAGTFAPESSEPVASNPIEAFVTEVGRTLGLTPPPDTVFVKRLIGIGGDRVQCCDDAGRITVNGVPLDEPYLYPGDNPSEQAFDVVVPPEHMWFMGDHRSASADSRSHLGDPGGGMVPVDRAIGRVTYVIWPLGNVARVESISSVPSG
jgi:signal peptidase I